MGFWDRTSIGFLFQLLGPDSLSITFPAAMSWFISLLFVDISRWLEYNLLLIKSRSFLCDILVQVIPKHQRLVSVPIWYQFLNDVIVFMKSFDPRRHWIIFLKNITHGTTHMGLINIMKPEQNGRDLQTVFSNEFLEVMIQWGIYRYPGEYLIW